MATLNFNYTIEGMLLRSKVCVNNVLEDIADLIINKPQLTKEELKKLIEEINYAQANLVGIDKTEELRSTTIIVTDLVKEAYNSLRAIKELVEINFEETAPEFLKHYGYNTYYSDVSKEKQEATISHLSVVAREGKELKKKFEKASLPTHYFDKVEKLAVELPNAEVKQEQLKGASKSITDEQYTKLNKIYEEVMKLCKLGRFTYRDNEIKKQRYVFKNLVSNNKRNGKHTEEENTTELNDEPKKEATDE